MARIIFSLVVLSAAALTACGGGTGAGSGGSGGAGGEAGAGGAAGAGGVAGMGGVGGAAGSGGTAGAGGAGGADPGLVPVFVAQGHVGRTMVSCDLGKTWVADRSDDDTVKCFDGLDCDHTSGAANGIVFGDGWFHATFGWGEAGGVRRSRDGVTWESALDGTKFGGMAFGGGVLIGAARVPWRSTDAGAMWAELPEIPLSIYNIRESAYAAHDTGRFVLVGNDNANRQIAVSDDGGATWQLPSFPADCDVSFYRSGGIAYGNGAIIITDGGKGACRSTDGGATWSRVDIGIGIAGFAWTGKEFMGWGGGQVTRSADGAAWKTEPITPANADIGIVGASDKGVLVAVSGSWQSWYDKQKFYRSEDGVTWEELPAASYTGSHPITAIAFGMAQKSSTCP